MTSLTRGPHPAGVYWRRRAALLLALVVLGVAVVSMLHGGGAGGDDGADVTASPAGSTPSETAAPSAPASIPATPEAETQAEAEAEAEAQPQATPTREPLATPVGRCDNADVLVTPEVVDAVAGRTVTLALAVRTATTEACTWRMSAQHLALTLTRGDDEVWSTRQCPGMVPEQDVVVRRDVDSTVTLDWDARYSQRGCTDQSGLVEPGDLQVAAAAYGGQPATADLVLRAPGAPGSGPSAGDPTLAPLTPLETSEPTGLTGPTGPTGQ